MKQISYKVTEPEGLHARPAGTLVKKAKEYQSSILIVRDDRSANAKQMLALMGLAVKCGDEISVTIEGADEEKAYAELGKFLAENL